MRYLRIVAWLLAAALGLGATVASAQWEASVGRNFASVYQRPDAKSREVSTVLRDQQLFVMSQSADGAWCSVSLSHGGQLLGYIKCDALSGGEAVPRAKEPSPAFTGPEYLTERSYAPDPVQAKQPSSGGLRPYSSIKVDLYMTDW